LPPFAPAVRSSLISWTAVVTGALVAVVSQFLLALLGAGVGATTTPAMDEGETAGMGLIWWIGSGLVSATLGGLAAGALSSQAGRSHAMCHGLLAWMISTLLVIAAMAGAFGGGIAASGAGGPMGAYASEAARNVGDPARASQPAARAGTTSTGAGAGAELREDMAITALASFVALLVGMILSVAASSFASRRVRAQSSLVEIEAAHAARQSAR
jgi:MFS family permease